MANISDIRNIVLLGHGSAGKTSLLEAILNTTGKTSRLGIVEDGSTVSDFDDEEKERGNSIHSALAYTEHNGKTINIIDTPGYPDFIGAALATIPAVEAGVIVIGASSGIEINTRKLFTAAGNLKKARIIVVNKMDADNVDLTELVGLIQETFGSSCRCANLPTAGKDGVIDCLSNTSGDSAVMSVENANTELIESIVEVDDDVMEKYLSGETIAPDKIAELFEVAMADGVLVPIVFTDSKNQKGITELLDLIAKCVPNPTQEGDAILVDGEEETPVKVDPNGPMAGHVFRIGFDPKSSMKFASVRMFSGKLSSGDSIHINGSKKTVRVGHPLKLQGAEPTDIDFGSAGEIITLAKIDELRMGDLIHDGSFKGKFKLPIIPKPMYSLAIEPASRGDEGKINAALEKLTEEDPCFTVTVNQQTHERVINGLGDLHLRVMLAKMEHRYKVKVTTKQPKIPYKETIVGKADGHYRHKKQSGGAGQFGEVYLRVEPAERDSDPSLEYSWDIFGGSIPGQFEPAVKKGVKDVMKTGVIAGFPMQDIKVSVYDGKYHAVDSKEVAFRAAGKGAFAEAVLKAKPALLEPIVDIEITAPADNMGDITGDMASRRGRVSGQDMLPGGMIMIKAQVPLSEVTQYNSQLKSVTGGQGSYSMELSHYDPIPPNVQQAVVAQYKKEKEEHDAKA